jgi:hypothetical protein
VKKEKSVSDTKKRNISKNMEKIIPKEKEIRKRRKSSVLKNEEYISETSIDGEGEKDHEIRKKADLPCIVEEQSMENSRKESNELMHQEKGKLEQETNPFKNSNQRDENMSKDVKARHRDFIKKPEDNVSIEQVMEGFGVKDSSINESKESSLRDRTIRSGIVSEGEYNRKRANAKNSFSIEKSVIEETVKEFKNLEIRRNKDLNIEINNSKEDHKDILIKMKLKNQEIEEESELQNQMAMEAIARITKKFQGKDFKNSGSMNAYDYKAQVQRLIKEASDPFNLCQSYSGWNPFL